MRCLDVMDSLRAVGNHVGNKEKRPKMKQQDLMHQDFTLQPAPQGSLL